MLTSPTSLTALGSEVSDQDVKATIAVGAYTARWYAGPTLAWLAERMGWLEWQGRIELNQLRRRGFLVPGGDRELRASDTGIEVALDCWRTERTERLAHEADAEHSRASVTGSRQEWTDAHRDQARALQAEGLSQSSIALEVCGDRRFRATIQQWLRTAEDGDRPAAA